MSGYGTATNDIHPRLSDAEMMANLRKENAKLRELAGYMIRCMQEHHNCVDCLVNGEQCDISCIESDLWELRIEVGE